MEDACNGVFSQTFTPDVFNYSIIQKVFCMCCICKENFIIYIYIITSIFPILVSE